uniref:uncharacterized protein At5g39865-like n=1 Tax=Erigeron canadensis TaxID=72917 RepID=UPI001CB8C24F|nr:uncharacterized protein At5g39865-like [Erigeron canadensis]
MGCTPSKESVCRNCQSQCSPIRRSYSSYGGHSPRYDSDNHGHHLVALTSTTLGYLFLNPDTPDQSSKPNQVCQDPIVEQVLDHQGLVPPKVLEMNNKDLPIEVIKIDTWSKMINESNTKNVPKTPIGTPPGEPETINTWELMEGLDDSSPLQPRFINGHVHCFSSNTTPFDQPKTPSQEKVNLYNSNSNSNGTSMSLEFGKNNGGDAKKLSQIEKNEIILHSKERLILYFTSLRGVRKTYEDCCHVQAILKNSGVHVDERDVSMHSGFREELKNLLGDTYGGSGVGLPKVFIGRKYIGGVDEIRRFHDGYQLDKVLEGCELADHGGPCEACGNIRFLPCETCSGSCKIYYEVNSDEGETEELEENDYGFQRCPDCNENGLVKCPNCWD